MHRIALAGERCLAEECHGPTLDALIATGFASACPSGIRQGEAVAVLQHSGV
jgi:hypothetical protein